MSTRVEAVVGTVVIPVCRNKRGVALAVGIDQQYTAVRRSRPAQDAGDPECDIGGGCRFPDPAFMIGEYEYAQSLPYPSLQPNGFRWAGNDFAGS